MKTNKNTTRRPSLDWDLYSLLVVLGILAVLIMTSACGKNTTDNTDLSKTANRVFNIVRSGH